MILSLKVPNPIGPPLIVSRYFFSHKDFIRSLKFPLRNLFVLVHILESFCARRHVIGFLFFIYLYLCI